MTMNPIQAAFVAHALEQVDGPYHCEEVNMRDGGSGFWGVDQLAGKLESTDHSIEWAHHNTKADQPEGSDRINMLKEFGSVGDWDDGFMVTKHGNLNGIKMKQAVQGCNIKFGFTSDVKDTSMYENGFYIGLSGDAQVQRGIKSGRAVTMGTYTLAETFTARILRGSVTCFRNEETEPFDVIGHCEEEGTSMHGMVHIKEKDALGQLEEIQAVAMVNSIDINGNLLTDAGVERLALALEVPFTKVHFLDLGLNRIRDAGAARIAKVIELHVSQIRTLVLSHNEIGDEGVTALAEALVKDSCLVTKVWLEGNQIADAGALKVAEMLENEHCKLELIELAWNKIEDDGAQAIIKALSKEQCKITYFTIDHNKIIEKKTKKMLIAIMAKVARFVDMT